MLEFGNRFGFCLIWLVIFGDLIVCVLLGVACVRCYALLGLTWVVGLMPFRWLLA